MPRRSRTKGASGSSRTRRPPVATPEAHRELEAQLDEIADVLATGDRERLTTLLRGLSTVPAFAPDVITRRLIEGRDRTPGITLTLLTDSARERAPAYLQRIVKARDAPDQVRYEAQRLLGWDAFREAKRRVAFLNTLRDPHGALVVSTDAIAGSWPARIEALADVAAYVNALSPPARYAALDRVIDESGWNAIPLLHGLLHVDDPVVQRRAVDELAAQRFSASPGPLRRLLQTTHDADLRQHIEHVLNQVDFDRQAGPESGESMFPGRGLHQFGWARVTRVDPDGGQALWVAREIGAGIYDAINIYVDGTAGLAEVNQYRRMPQALLEADVAMIDGDFAPWTTIDLSVARGLLEWAISRYAESGQSLPFELELYEPMLHDAYPPAADEAIVVPILDDQPYVGRADLIDRGGELLDHPLFNEWAYRIDDVMEAIASEPMPAPDADPDEVHRSLAKHMLDAPARSILRDALRRQAWLLGAAGNPDERDIALAVAAWLPDAEDEQFAGNELVIGLIQMSLAATAKLFEGPDLLPELADLLEGDWLLDGIEDEQDELISDDGTIEATWTAAPETDEQAPPDR